MIRGRMMRLAIILAVLMLVGAEAQADAIRQACLASERGTGQRGLCTCIQSVADQTLTARDQKRAARFFKDPDIAQETRRSDRPRDEDFWDRYERFGDYAQKICR